MFSNLIESSSHRSELKRRGSFVLYTIVSYLVIFALAGVASIYAYDAHLEDQNLEIVTLMPITDFPVPQTAPPERAIPHSSSPGRQMFDERPEAMVSVNRPDVPPTTVSSTPNKNPPIRDGSTTLITGRTVDAGGLVGPGAGSSESGRTTTPQTIVVEVGTPPPPLEQKPKPVVISKGPITGEALVLPKPVYPQMAKMMHLQGKVNVQVLIDETGKVISARTLDGHPMFREVAQTAAFQARFSPTRLGDQPVKVSGVITYNFILQ
jgi:TonB family protein